MLALRARAREQRDKFSRESAENPIPPRHGFLSVARHAPHKIKIAVDLSRSGFTHLPKEQPSPEEKLSAGMKSSAAIDDHPDLVGRVVGGDFPHGVRIKAIACHFLDNFRDQRQASGNSRAVAPR